MPNLVKEHVWLADSFTAELGDQCGLAESQELEEVLERCIEGGARAWPNLSLAPERFVRRLAFAADKIGGDVLAALAKIRVSDLYLACACLHGDEQAIAEVDRNVLPLVEPAVRAMGADAACLDEVMQQLRHTLFVPREGCSPAIATYAGRAQLRSWVRSIAVRTASRVMASANSAAAGDEVLESMPAGDDPELEYLKAHYGETFRASLHEQLASLEERQRNILRQHFIDGLSIDELGVLYSVHRATAARWLAATRKTLLEGTRERIMTNLRVNETEFDSIARLVRSQLDISLGRFLK